MMSYLNLPDGIPDFKKAVISFWFRVPQKSLDSAAASYIPGQGTIDDSFPSNPDQENPPTQLNGIVPLVTFGQIFDAYTLHMTHEVLGSFTERILLYTGGCNVSVLSTNTFPIDLFKLVKNKTYKLDQSYVGIDCSPMTDDNGNPIRPRLCLRLQTGNTPVASGILWQSASATSSSFDVIEQSSYPYGPDGPPELCEDLTYKTITDGPFTGDTVFVNKAGHFTTSTFNDDTSLWVGMAPEAITGSSKAITITADAWHHLLISFDLSGTIQGTGNETSLISSCKLWVALDDKNYNGNDLPSTAWPDVSHDPNAVITPNALLGWSTTTPSNSEVNFVNSNGEWGTVTVSGYSETPSNYTLTGTTIPVNGQSIGLPATATMGDHIYKVEMAEFLMWTGVTLDTSVEANRRLFITAPNKNGVQFPVNQAPLMVPINKNAAGDPAAWEPGADASAFVPGLFDPSGVPSANKPLGIADIDFTKCSFNWMMGRNLGKAKGKFVKTGKIKAYSPDPKLGG